MNKLSFETGKVIKLADTSNPAYMTLDMIVCDSNPNLNSQGVTKDFIIANHQTLVDMPIQVDRFRIENGMYSSLTHRYEKGELKTDSIGVITNTWYETDESTDVTTLYASAKIWKRYPKTCEAIAELYEQEDLKFSWELVGTEKDESIETAEMFKNGYWIGHTLVSNPSYPIAKSTMLVAELKELNLEKEEVENLEILIAGMSIDMLREKISKALNYDMYIIQMFLDDGKVVVRDWSTDASYIIPFTVDGETVTVDVENKIEASVVVKPKDEVSEQDLRIAELEKQIEELTAEKVEEPIVEPIVETDETKEVIAEEIIEEVKDVVDYAEIIAELTKKIELLEPLAEQAKVLAEEKAQVELAELKGKLKAKAERVLAEGDELTESMLAAIEEADEKTLKIAIGEYAIEMAQKVLSKESEIKTAETKDVVIGVSDSDYSVDGKKSSKIELY